MLVFRFANLRRVYDFVASNLVVVIPASLVRVEAAGCVPSTKGFTFFVNWGRPPDYCHAANIWACYLLAACLVILIRHLSFSVLGIDVMEPLAVVV